MADEKTFTAVLEPGDKALGWTIARVPFDPGTVWNGMVRLRVTGTLNGFAFRTSLFLDVRGYYLLVNRATQRGSGVSPGMQGRFLLEPDRAERPADLPDELALLLEEEDGLRRFYDELSEYTRREIGKWVNGVKSDAARMKRSEQVAERLLATMDAERELPPSIAVALQRNAKARAGWGRMTTLQRRNELMAVFSYQGVEARQKRVGKLVAMAESKG